MKNLMIKIVDAVMMLAVIIAVLVAVLVGSKQGPAQAALFGVVALIVMSFICAFWFALSGIYHNTKTVAEAMK